MVANRTMVLAVSAALLTAATIVNAPAQPNPSNSTSSINGDWLPGQRPHYGYHHHSYHHRYYGYYPRYHHHHHYAWYRY
jgi:hypothetical protein